MTKKPDALLKEQDKKLWTNEQFPIGFANICGFRRTTKFWPSLIDPKLKTLTIIESAANFELRKHGFQLNLVKLGRKLSKCLSPSSVVALLKNHRDNTTTIHCRRLNDLLDQYFQTGNGASSFDKAKNATYGLRSLAEQLSSEQLIFICSASPLSFDPVAVASHPQIKAVCHYRPPSSNMMVQQFADVSEHLGADVLSKVTR